jgi:hypothetical protein
MEAFSRTSFQWQQLLGLEPADEFDISPQSILTKLDRVENSKIIKIKT